VSVLTDVDWIPSTRHLEDWRVIEVVAELLRVQRGGRDENLDVGTEARDILDQTEQHIRMTESTGQEQTTKQQQQSEGVQADEVHFLSVRASN
jgi:hypothetical protein